MKTRADYSLHMLACAMLADQALKKGDSEAASIYAKQVSEASDCLQSALASDEPGMKPGHSVLELVFPEEVLA